MPEFSIIQRYFQRAKPLPNSVLLGIGDDAAVIQPPADQILLASTDTLVASRHFPIQTDAFSIGWKSAAVNLSDMAAMGGTPHSILLALSLPPVFAQDAAWLQGFADGLFTLCDREQVSLIGGDTTQSPTLSITITVLGFAPKTQIIRRHGAQIGDLVVVSGTLGDAAYALKNSQSAVQHRLDRPEPRLALGVALRGLASAMLDISDGFAQDLQHLLSASGVGAVIQLETLPYSSTLALLPDRQKQPFALTGGDDYELCFTISPDDFARLKGKNVGVDCHVVGYITGDEALTFIQHGQPVTFNHSALRGYQHFA